MGGEQEWAGDRDRAVAARTADLARREAAEAGEAAAALRGFVATARERDLAPVPLRARSYDGRSRYRTRLRGWYLRRDETMAVAEDGCFYVLTVPGSLRARFAAADVVPSRPRLVLGAGAGDGESVPLRAVLARILEESAGA